MSEIDSKTVYSYAASDGNEYNYQFSEPIIRQQDRVFFGFARAWKKEEPAKYFNILVDDRSFAEEYYKTEAVRGIEFHIAQA